MTTRKARIYKMQFSYGRNPWVSILPSGSFGVFATWAEALEFQGARLDGSND